MTLVLGTESFFSTEKWAIKKEVGEKAQGF